MAIAFDCSSLRWVSGIRNFWRVASSHAPGDNHASVTVGPARGTLRLEASWSNKFVENRKEG
jgi:hypothetical protein